MDRKIRGNILIITPPPPNQKIPPYTTPTPATKHMNQK